MCFSVSNKFEKYKVPPQVENSARTWDNAEIYKTTYFQNNAKNPLAMKNSTEQLLFSKTKKLRAVSSQPDLKVKPIENSDFIIHDYQHQYRTSTNDMTSKMPKLLNSFYLPRYSGFVPGMKSENPFGACYSRLAKEQINNFDNRRFNRNNSFTYKTWKYNPISRVIGNFWNKKSKQMDTTVQSSLVNHPYTSDLRDSGYSNNLFPSKMSSAWLNKCYESDMKRTEYRLQYNTRKAIQYTGPTFNTGFLKQKEHNYKYT